MHRIRGGVLFLLSLVLHIAAGGVIWYFWQPIASWYFNYRPILGVDFYSLASYAGYLSRHFVFYFSGWHYAWWGGAPLANLYPVFHAYFILLLLQRFSLPEAILVYALVTTFLFLFFSCLLFVEIGKNRVLAVVLALGSAFSIGLYGGLVWGGSLNYYMTQFFLPLTLWLLFKYFNTNDTRWFYLSSLSTGISFLGHPLVGFSYIIPISFLLLLTHPIAREKYISFSRMKRLMMYFVIAVAAGYSQLKVFFGPSPIDPLIAIPSILIDFFIRGIFARFKLPTTSPSIKASPTVGESGKAIAEWTFSNLNRFFSDINPVFYVLLLISIVLIIFAFVLRKKRSKVIVAVVYLLPGLWIVMYLYLYAVGIPLFQGGWYRAFWAFPMTLGIFISFGWGEFVNSIKERFRIIENSMYLRFLLTGIVSSTIFLIGFILLTQNSAGKMITAIETPGYRQGSSAYPDSLNFYTKKNEFEDLKKRLTPRWLDPNNTQYRFYDADQRVNIWWGALYDMPLVRGYIDVANADATGAFYWTSIALTQSSSGDPLVKTWGNSEEIAYNNALFLIDWFSIKYIEAEHTWSDSFNPLTSYIAASDIFEHKEQVNTHGWGQLYELPAGVPLKWHPEVEQYLTYYGIKDSYVSPILHTTDAKVVGFIGTDDAYMTIFRDLAATNLNSRHILPIRLGKYIDDIPLESLYDMDAVILYSYDYRNHGNAWKKITKYVENGGKIFIETGSDVKQTDSVNLPANFPKELPEIMPIKKTKRMDLGKEWNITKGDSSILEGVDTDTFGPLILDKEPWYVSVPPDSLSIKEDTEVILSDNDKPLLITWGFGKGKVIWSGMNLPYHITFHKNMAEALLFKNILGSFIPLESVGYKDFNAMRKSPHDVMLQGVNAKGVLFRENAYPEWSAKLTTNKKSSLLRIYKTGPTLMGFMYVKIPQQTREDPFTVSFSYHGEIWGYFWIGVLFVIVLFILDRVLFRSRIFIPLANKISRRFKFKVGKWWEKEDEY